jgi:dipeptidyl aminopeptidase/acylaminoacyl peptidase
MTSYVDFRPTLRLQESMALSYDGKALAYADDATGQFNIVVADVESRDRRRLTDLSTGSVRSVDWSPDGTSLVYFADTGGDEHAQMYICNAEGGSRQNLTANPSAQYRPPRGRPFSPDGRLLAFSGNDRTPTDDDVLIRDMVSGQITRIEIGAGLVFAGHWSPDGDRLTIVHWRRGMEDHAVYVWSAVDNSVTRLTTDDIETTYAPGPWLPDGSGFLIRSHGRRDFMGLAVMDARTGEMTWLDTPDWDVELIASSGDGGTAGWLVNVGGRSELRNLDLRAGDSVGTPTLPAGVVRDMVMSPDATSAIIQLSTPTRPNNIAVVNIENGHLEWLTDAVPMAANPANFVEPELIHYSARAGHQLPGYLFRPRDLTRPVGVVISIHGGPSAQERPTYRYDGFYQHLVEAGLAVLAPNIRGSSGYGHLAEEAIYGKWGTIDLEDVEATVAYLRGLPWVDPSRIGIYGGSYGGFVVLSALARLPELRWAAAVSQYGISNLVTAAKASPPTWRSWVNRAIGDYETDAESMLARSPLTYVDNIRAPLFILQGANDVRVPREESEQIVSALRARGIPVRYDVYENEGHGFTHRDNQIKSDSDSADFLIQHLT